MEVKKRTRKPKTMKMDSLEAQLFVGRRYEKKKTKDGREVWKTINENLLGQDKGESSSKKARLDTDTDTVDNTEFTHIEEWDGNNDDWVDLEDTAPPVQPRKVSATLRIISAVHLKSRQTQHYYVKQFQERVDDLLFGSLSREAMLKEQLICSTCSEGAHAAWRCVDCAMGVVKCRTCMRHSHRENPFHRIQRWCGSHYRPAELWEVGAYILVVHHTDGQMCSTLEMQKQYLESREKVKDDVEQERLRAVRAAPTAGQGRPEPLSAEERANEGEVHGEFGDYLRSKTGLSNDEEDGKINNDFVEEENAPIESAEDAPTGIPEYLGPTGATGDDGGNTRLPRQDIFRNGYVRVVHTNGVHNLAMVYCICHGEKSLAIDLLASRLVPASFEQVKTLFTAQVLDHACLCNLELKSSTYQYYSLLKRTTSPMAPSEVVNLYNVFRRMLRLWRWMKKLKWAGYGNWVMDVADIGEGGLANYCVACPIEGVNLEKDWRDDPHRWAYRRTFVADGNFKADHVKPPKPSADIWLSEGSGMDPVRSSYWSFLKTAFEKLTKAPCENTFRAIKNSLLASKACDITGKAAIACARHGCYAPAAAVDLYQGEQQKNVDFALLQAIKTTKVTQGQDILLIYDIACQYSIHLQSRIGDKLPDGMNIDYAIGLFHVHAHKDLCFFRYATSFIPGAAIVIGEIMEPLWSELNKISPAARTATTAHRSEVISDHACDSNHKKCLGMTAALCKRIKEAEIKSHECQEAYKMLTTSLDGTLVQKWLEEVLAAEARRSTDISAMDIYVPRLTSGPTALSGEMADPTKPKGPIEVYMEFATVVEQRQKLLYKKQPAETQRIKIDQLQEELQRMIQELLRLQKNAGVTEVQGPLEPSGPGNEINEWEAVADESGEELPDSAGGDVGPSNGEAGGHGFFADTWTAVLPSNGNADPSLCEIELQVREEQAHKLLNHLRDIIAEKSFQFPGVGRVGTKQMKLRSRNYVRELNQKIGLYAAMYTRCRRKMIKLNADPDKTNNVFRELTKEDVKASTAILKPNIPGSTKLKLSWIWHSVRKHLMMGLTADGTQEKSGVDAATRMEFHPLSHGAAPPPPPLHSPSSSPARGTRLESALVASSCARSPCH
ncbi:hypothetical protein D9613_012877 [Agrocybe pediades]|uniref:CxC2-like cysteine cluster KDZ transposase-associated domain-containing protein n=1 Tax=Agrocybe pediades TaxID=84607 RepID=A0A8H4QWM4_9AGAR|nr:hypothetical protein D9613_012877 [Agrocybe pediades]